MTRIVQAITPMIVMIAIAFVSIGGTATATNGYFSHGYGTQSKALGGATVAYPQSGFSAATNPAGMVWSGSGYDFSISLFNPNREYTVTGNPSGQQGTFPLTPGRVESDSKLFVIPGLAANWMIDEKYSVGVTLYANGGMNTNYDTKTFNNPQAPVTQPTGVDLGQFFAAATYSRKLADQHSIGVTGIFGFQRFEARGLQAFGGFSTDGTKLTDNKHATSTGFGGKFGYLGKLSDRFQVGASYQTKMYMSKFDDYAGLFAEQGDFDIPSSWSVGAAVQAADVLWIMGEVQQVRYSEVVSVSNPMNPANFQQGVLLGSDNGSGFGWEDMTTYKFGLEWEGLADMPFRAGYSFGKQPIPDTETMFNILAPGVIEQHLTFGFSRKMCKGKELSVAIMHGLSKSVTGDNPMEVPGAQQIELKMNQWEFTVGLHF